jgi:aldose 1-epimerase
VAQVGIENDLFGVTSEGTPVERWTLRNRAGAVVRLIAYGATVTEWHVPSRAGAVDDVVLGFDRLDPYETQSPYFGCTVGRVAFRITGGRFRLNGKEYQLSLNVPPHHLHGGVRGLSRVVWRGVPFESQQSLGVRFTHHSPDGDQGYPGNLDVEVVYALGDDNALRIDYVATADRPTPVNLTHHSYFNLAGHASGDVLGHVLQLEASRYTPLDARRIPTGQIASVEGTPYDFRKPTAIGARMSQVLAEAGGYDLSYLRDAPGDNLVRVATLAEPRTGRVMEVHSTQPAIVLYTGNYLDGTLRGKGGAVYRRHAGVCIETAHLPDSVNQPAFPSIVLGPGQRYRHTCVYRFS